MSELSRRVWVLLLVAGTFLTLGLLTGMLGVNLRSVGPTPYAWYYVCACAALALLLTRKMWTLRRHPAAR